MTLTISARRWLLASAAVACGALGVASPAGAQRVVFGRSVRGRPLVAWSYGSSHARRKILVVGCIHGNECAGLAITRARKIAPEGARIEVECETIAQVEAAIANSADIVLLDNMTTPQLAECVVLVDGRAIVEASGRVRLENVRAIAETGVDWISAGSLTHSPPALDLALDFD